MSAVLRSTTVGAAMALGTALVLAACSAPPSDTQSAGTSDFLPCAVGDSGGFADKSFNQLTLEGVVAAADAIGSDHRQVQAKTAEDQAAAVDSLVAENCNIIAAPGFNFVEAVKAAATSSPDTDFAMIDDGSIDLPNVKGVVFNTNQAAFLGGYAAAAYSKSGVVGTWGGAQFPSVTLYMDGLAEGIRYYNEQKGADVRLLGWDVAAQTGTFVGNFTDQAQARTITQNFLDQGADVIVPIGGSLYQGAVAALKAAGGDAVLIGVDADLYETDSANGSLFLTSILKRVDVATEAVVEQAASGDSFDTTLYVGTLENEGVGLAPFHDFEDQLPSGLTDELDTITQGIIDGSITVESPSQFSQ